MSPRYSGRTAMPNIKDVQQHLKPPDDMQTPFSFSMEGTPTEPPSALIPRFWSPSWNSQEAINKFQIEVGHGLHGGEAGKRLFEPSERRGDPCDRPPANAMRVEAEATRVEADATRVEADATRVEADATQVRANTRFAPTKKDQILLIPMAEIFGSEASSRQSEALAELIPKAYLEVHPDTASQRKLKAGERRVVSWQNHTAEFVIRINESVPPDAGIVPARFPETRHMQTPVVASVGKKVS